MSESPVVEIVEALAEAKGTAPDALDLRLQDHIDTDAIVSLSDHENASWTLSFELPKHEVTVTSDGLVLVDGVRRQVWA